MIKLVAFDWNGTILSDTNAVLRAENAVLKKYKLPLTNLRQFQATYTIPIIDYWVAMGIDRKLFFRHGEEIQRTFQKNYELQESTCRTRAGSKEILSWLHKNKIKNAIFSNHVAPHIRKQLLRLDLAMYFDTVLAREIGDTTHLHSRSKGIKLKKCVKTLKIKPAEFIVVADTIEEIEIGNSLGCYTTALIGGWNSTRRLKAAKPDFLIHNLRNLKKIVTSLNESSLLHDRAKVRENDQDENLFMRIYYARI